MNNIYSSNPTQVQIFDHQEFSCVRAAQAADGQVLFVARDVLAALGYRNISKALADHVDEDDITKSYPIVDRLGRRQKVSVINESGLYALILSSKLPRAKTFKQWVTSEVLPQIRRTGGYIPTRNARTGERLTDEEIVDKALGIMQKTIEEVNGPAEACFTMTQLACEFGIEPKDLCSFLRDRGIIAWRKGRYCLQPRYQQQGYDDERLYCYFTRHGHSRSKPYLVWTPAGKRFVESIVNGKQVA